MTNQDILDAFCFSVGGDIEREAFKRFLIVLPRQN